jgi:hypothetical protein
MKTILVTSLIRMVGPEDQKRSNKLGMKNQSLINDTSKKEIVVQLDPI